jgi:hypothetical protein
MFSMLRTRSQRNPIEQARNQEEGLFARPVSPTEFHHFICIGLPEEKQ